MGDSKTDATPGSLPSRIYGMLHERYGDLGWWPAEGHFQVMVGAVLAQRTAWTNAQRAMDRMKEARVDGPQALLSLSDERLEELLRPSGTYRQKAARLKALFQRAMDVSGGSLEAFLALPVERLRRELLSVKGIGPETADSIVLYAAGWPVFVVDAYTRRILARLEVDAGTTYEQVAAWFTGGLPDDADLFNNYHAALVELAKDHCRTSPVCRGCPLGPICPTGGP